MNNIYKAIFSLFLILFLCSYKKPIKRNDWLLDELKGKVKRIEETVQNFDTVNSDKPSIKQTTKIYNENGYLIAEENNKRDSILYQRNNYFYNDSNQLIAWERYNSDSSLDLHYIFYNFNKHGQQTEALQVLGKDSYTTKWKNIYDKKGNLIEYLEYNSDNSIRINKTYKFNRKGQVISWRNYNKESQLSFRGKKRYDFRGNLKKSKWFDSGKHVYGSVSYKFNKNGNLIKNFVRYKGKLRYTFRYVYDNFGNLIQSNKYGIETKTSDIFVFEFTYDSAGNWIKKTESRNNRIYYIIERKIEYFK